MNTIFQWTPMMLALLCVSAHGADSPEVQAPSSDSVKNQGKVRNQEEVMDQEDEEDHKEDANNLDIDAYLNLGIDHYGSFHDKKAKDSTTNYLLRKAKLGFDYRLNKEWRAELGLNYSHEGNDQDLELGDANIDYRGFKFAHIQVGRMLEPFGFERLGGFSSLITNERSLATSVFAPGRSSYGIRLNDKKKAYTWALGVFQESSDSESPQSVTGRFTMAPVRGDAFTLHMGLAASYRDLQEQSFQIKDEAEVFSADNVVRSARFDADTSTLLGGELAWLYKSVTFSSEVMSEQVTQTDDTQWDYSGFYAQLSFLVTGEQREYSKGEFKRIKPQSQYGAVELVTRFSAVDLRDHELGAKAQVLLMGINYYLKKSFLIRLNYLMPDISGNALNDNPEGDAITLRAQYRF
ncbi:hypothetical protein BTA51_19000 [Hahella sp. CCB-MM4]|uniref:OprO/OprP family phosphate-selective porin n=1 Tax=Hahella sp. (strain CCB-MM4) TaxID=1926491 RepID=UPI000B9C2BE1|nr:porin [Hahella sp. CCB-MM4]OZG71731.1 hypothetical protein BTA51_19000 [Hahella sp. CCB-MM4]